MNPTQSRNRKYWTHGEIEFLRAYGNQMALEELAQQLRRSVKAIALQLSKERKAGRVAAGKFAPAAYKTRGEAPPPPRDAADKPSRRTVILISRAALRQLEDKKEAMTFTDPNQLTEFLECGNPDGWRIVDPLDEDADGYVALAVMKTRRVIDF